MRRLQTVSILAAVSLFAAGCGADTETDEDSAVADDGTDTAESTDAADEGGSAGGEVTVLAFNDFHGAMDSAEAFACTVELTRQEHPHTLLVSAGDDVGASQFESAVQDDQPTLDLYNALEVDAAALGNHEFDQGYEDITDRLEQEADFDHLAANLFHADSEERAATPYETYEVEGLEVAVVGAVTDETPELVVPEGVADVEFRDPIESVQEVVEEELDDADVIIASFHAGSPEQVEVGEAPEDEWTAAVHEALGEHVDLVTEGHTHNTYAYEKDGLTVLQTGAQGANLGVVTLTVEEGTGEVTASEPELRATEDTDVEDCAEGKALEETDRFDEAAGIVADAEEHAEEVGSEVLTSQESDVTTGWSAEEAEYVDGTWQTESSGGGDDRTLQSTMGSLVADFHQDMDAWPEDVDIDVGLINAGGLRADIRGDGEVTLRDAVDVVPFNNRLVALEMTGEELAAVLEQQWGEDGYQQFGVSSNLRYTYDSEAEEGERITSLRFDGEPLGPEDTVTVGIGEFLAGGGDGFSVFAEVEDRKETEVIDTEVWPDYLSSFEEIVPDYAQRAVELRGVSGGDYWARGEELSLEVSAVHSMSLGAPEVSSVTLSLRAGEEDIGLGSADYRWEDGVGSADFDVVVPDQAPEGEAELVVSADAGDTEAVVPVTITD